MLSGEAGIVPKTVYEQVQAADMRASPFLQKERFNSYAQEKQAVFITLGGDVYVSGISWNDISADSK